jgi:hypothetical protein
MESVLMGHPERVSPFCVREIELYDGDGRLLDRLVDNHRTQRVIELSPPVDTAKLTLRLRKPNDLAPIALLACRCYV